MEQQLVQVLEMMISPNPPERLEGWALMDNAIAADFAAVLLALSEIMQQQQIQVLVRIEAARVVMNVVYLKEDQWLHLHEDIRAVLKGNIRRALATQDQGSLQAAQCVARVACVELPGGHWPELINSLLANITGGVATEALKRPSLEAIGYICNELEDPDILQPYCDSIYEAIMPLFTEDQSNHVILGAATALFQFLKTFIFELDDKEKRDDLMSKVFVYALRAGDAIAVWMLRCLRMIMKKHYSQMELGIFQDLTAITNIALQSPLHAIVLQGIEFWSTVCEEEIKITRDAAESAERGLPVAASHCKFYTRGAVKFLVPLLLEILERQEEGDDEDEWNPHKAAGVCLGLLSQACEEAIVELVLPYVQQSIRHADWRKRDAAVMAFGSILEGPSPGSLEPLVTQAMPVITKLLSDPMTVVRDTAFWTFDRICEVLPEVPLSDACLSELVNAMVAAHSREPEVSRNVCWAFSSLAKGAKILKTDLDGDGQPGLAHTYKLIPYFDQIAKQLLQTTNRPDWGQSGLLKAASNALMGMIRSAPRDCQQSLQHTLNAVLQKLEGILGMEQAALSAQDRSQLVEYQWLLCCALRFVLYKINRAYAREKAQVIIKVLMMMFDRSHSRLSPLNNNNNNPADPEQTTARSLLPDIISAIGDIFPFLGNSIPQVRPKMINTLIETCRAEFVLSDPNMIDYLNILNLKSIKAFRTLINCDWDLENITYDIIRIIKFMGDIVAQQFSGDKLIGECCDLVEMIATRYSISSLEYLETDPITNLLDRGRKSKMASTKMYADLAIEEINNLRNMLDEGW